jgi:hypothetical protein
VQLLNDVRQKAGEFVSANAAVLLTGGGVVGTVATGLVAWRGGYKTAEKIGNDKVQDLADQLSVDSEAYASADLDKWDKAKIAIPQALPPIVIGGATIASIIMGHKVSAQKAAALAAAYGLAERNLSEYKAKVEEKLTGPKKTAIEDEIAQDRVTRTSGHENIVIVEGEVLCFDEPTGRYFRSTMEDIKTAVNSTNAEILNHEFANASFFYEELGLPATTWTDEVGWNHDQLLDLKYSTVLTPDNKPCISIDFKVLPKAEYVPKHY